MPVCSNPHDYCALYRKSSYQANEATGGSQNVATGLFGLITQEIKPGTAMKTDKCTKIKSPCSSCKMFCQEKKRKEKEETICLQYLTSRQNVNR